MRGRWWKWERKKTNNGKCSNDFNNLTHQNRKLAVKIKRVGEGGSKNQYKTQFDK